MNYKYCPLCSGRLKLIDKHPKCQECGFILWQNSKPTVTALIINSSSRDDKILLGKRNIEPFKNWWDLPGGFLENGEDPIKGLQRELKEEIGVNVLIGKLHGIFLDNYKDDFGNYKALCLHYRAIILPSESNTLKSGGDVKALKWVALNKLDINKVAFKSNQKSLKQLLKNYES